jgi:alpha-1,4-digalacturonate transport system permease protein
MKKKLIVQYIIAIILIFVFLVPVVYIISSSFKPLNELFSASPTFFPKSFTFDNFAKAFSKNSGGNYKILGIGVPYILLVIFNSFIVATASTFLAIVINTMSGYALAKFRFKGDNIIMVIILSTIMLPLEVIMVPIFSVLRFFGLYNSLWALIIPAAATPTGIFLMRQYLLTIPGEIIESARIDGASEWKIFTKIILPNAKPAIATLAIFSFMWRWNDYVWPLIAISSPGKYTLQLYIANLTGEFGSDYSSILATSVISMIPMLVVFIIFQKQFVQGTVESGMKG